MRESYPLELVIDCLSEDMIPKFKVMLDDEFYVIKLYFESLFKVGVVGIPAGLQLERLKTFSPPPADAYWVGWDNFINDVKTAEKFDLVFQTNLFSRSCRLSRDYNIRVIENITGPSANSCVFSRKKGRFSRFFTDKQLEYALDLHAQNIFATPSGKPIATGDTDKPYLVDFKYDMAFLSFNFENFEEIMKLVRSIPETYVTRGLTWYSFVYENPALRPSRIRLISFGEISRPNLSGIPEAKRKSELAKIASRNFEMSMDSILASIDRDHLTSKQEENLKRMILDIQDAYSGEKLTFQKRKLYKSSEMLGLKKFLIERNGVDYVFELPPGFMNSVLDLFSPRAKTYLEMWYDRVAVCEDCEKGNVCKASFYINVTSPGGSKIHINRTGEVILSSIKKGDEYVRVMLDPVHTGFDRVNSVHIAVFDSQKTFKYFPHVPAHEVANVLRSIFKD